MKGKKKMFTVKLFLYGGVIESLYDLLTDAEQSPDYYDEDEVEMFKKLYHYKGESFTFKTMKEVAQFADEIRSYDFSVSLSILDENSFGLDIDVY